MRYALLLAAMIALAASPSHAWFGVFADEGECPFCCIEADPGSYITGQMGLYLAPEHYGENIESISEIHLGEWEWLEDGDHYTEGYLFYYEWTASSWEGGIHEWEGGLTLYFDPPIVPEGRFGWVPCGVWWLICLRDDPPVFQNGWEFCYIGGDVYLVDGNDIQHYVAPAWSDINPTGYCSCYMYTTGCPYQYTCSDFFPESDSDVGDVFELSFDTECFNINTLCEENYSGEVLLEDQLVATFSGTGFRHHDLTIVCTGYEAGDEIDLTVTVIPAAGECLEQRYYLSYIYDGSVSTQSISLSELKRSYE